MARDNRYFERPTTEDIQDVNKNELLLKILRNEFPDDYLIQEGRLEHNAKEETAKIVAAAPIAIAKRSPDGIMRMSDARDEYVEISAIKAVPTVDDEELDEIIDEEYEYFLDPADPGSGVIPVTGEFFMKPLSPLNPVDYHDLYIRRGPATIGDREGPLEEIVNDTFCVFFIQNDVALPVPNYKTLEVMLVERSLTYADIKTAGEAEILRFDMNLDGDFAGDPTADEPADPVEEFRYRQLGDRSFQWSERIRFESGYTPGGEFKRDPGDYLKAPTLGQTLTKGQREELDEIYITEDPEDRYYDRVFQGQTYKEKLREKFEGKMIIGAWPTDDDFSAEITSNYTVATRFDDLSRTLRMMIAGYWKQVTDIDTINVYAYINNIDISGKRVIEPGSNPAVLVDQFIEERGALNQLIAAGGVTALQEIVEDAETLPVWNDFPHIAEIDALDKAEYEEYIDNFIDPFDVDYLKPYEPPGSIKYYNKVKVLELQDQAQAQARLDEIKDALIELTTDIAPKVAELNQILSLGDDLDGSYIIDGIGSGADIYNILNANSDYEWIKKRNNGNIKIKSKKQSIMKIIGKGRVKRTMSGNKRDRLEELADALGVDFRLNDRTEARSRDRNIPKAVKQDSYNGINLAGTYDDLYERAESVKDDIVSARGSLNQLNEVIADVDVILTDSTNPDEVNDAYNTIIDLLAELRTTSDVLEEAQNVRTEMDKTRRQYVNECYKFVQTVRKSVNNDNSKYAVKWANEAKKIVNAYVPGKNFSNYLPDGVE